MKNLVTALAVVLGLCAYAAPRASAQTADALLMKQAVNNYGNAAVYAQDAFNLTIPGTVNWTNAGTAHDLYLAAQTAAQASHDCFVSGNTADGINYATQALQNSYDAGYALDNSLQIGKAPSVLTPGRAHYENA